MEKGIVHLCDLPRNYQVYIKLNNKTEINLLSSALEITRLYKDLALEIKTTKSVIEKLFSKHTDSFSLDVLEKLSNFLVERTGNVVFSLKNLEKNIAYIKTKGSTSGKIYNPKFPMNFDNSNGGVIIGGLLGDGGIRKDFRPLYSNKDKIRINYLCNCMGKVIGEYKRSKLYEVESPTKENSITYVAEFPKIVGYILCHGLGMVRGDKVISDPPLPEFCFNSKKKFTIGLLKTFFTDEGTPHRVGKDLAPQITFRQSSLLEYKKPPKRSIGIKILLENLGLNPILFLETTYKKKKGEVGVYNLSINRIKETTYFSKCIGFSCKIKNEKLKNYLKKTTRGKSIRSNLT